MIWIYPQNETAFTGSGYGSLPDAVSCTVTEELNGAFLLEMSYPRAGANAERLELRNIILVKANPYDSPNAFRITDISKDIAGLIAVKAQHISYDLFGIPVAPFAAANIGDALTALTSYSQVTNPFSFVTTRTVATAFENKLPASCRALLGGSGGSLIDTYGGEWSFDKFECRLWLHRGQDRGVQIRYGKNMTALDHETEGEVYTGVYPYWTNEEGELVTCGVVNATGTFNFTRIKTMDFSDKFETKPTALALQSRAQLYLVTSSITSPNVSLKVSFVDLAQTEEYSQLTSEIIKLGDTVSIIYDALGITASAKVNKTTYDALLDRYTEIELGKAKHSLAETIAESAEVMTEDGKVNGGEIAENSISREQLRADAIRSTNYEGGWTIVYDGSDGTDHDEVSYSFKIGTQIYAFTSAGGSVPVGHTEGYDTGIVVNHELTQCRFYTISTRTLLAGTYAITQETDWLGDILPVSADYGFIFSGSFLDLYDGELHTAALEITKDEARFRGDIKHSRLQHCTGLTETYTATESGDVEITGFDTDTYAASAYGGRNEIFTYYEDDIDTPGWYDSDNNLVDFTDLGITTTSPNEGDIIVVNYDSTYSKIITLKDLQDLGLIP